MHDYQQDSNLPHTVKYYKQFDEIGQNFATKLSLSK